VDVPVFRMIARRPYTMVMDTETGEQVPLYGYRDHRYMRPNGPGPEVLVKVDGREQWLSADRFLFNISPEAAALMERLKIP